MLDFLQPIFPFAFAILWVGPSIVLYFRFRQKQVAYLRQFPPIDRYRTLDMASPGPGGSPPGTYRRINKAMLQRQTAPERERLRRDMWQRYGFAVLWIFGFPLITVGMVALLIIAGLVHPH